MVDNIGNIGGVNPQTHARKLKNVYRMDEPSKAADGVELSSEVMKLRGIEGIRMDKVMEVKRAIADGTYLTGEKLNKALDKAIDEIEAED